MLGIYTYTPYKELMNMQFWELNEYAGYINEIAEARNAKN